MNRKTTTLAACAALSLAFNGWAAYGAIASYKTLQNCAQGLNVYSCTWEAQPSTPKAPATLPVPEGDPIAAIIGGGGLLPPPAL